MRNFALFSYMELFDILASDLIIKSSCKIMGGVKMNFAFLVELIPIFMYLTAISFGLGMLSLMFLGIRIRYLKKALKKWTKENKRISNDPTLDKIVKIYRMYNEQGCEKINTSAIIHGNYYKQKIFFIPIYYWEQFISKSEILCLFFGLITTFILVSCQKDNPFDPLIFGTGTFIFLVILEMFLSLDAKKKYLFAQIEEYLDNSYRYSLQRTMVTAEYFDKEKIELFDMKEGKEEEIKDEEIEWVIKQFYDVENEV